MVSYRHITSRCFVNVPFKHFDYYRKMIVEHRLQPEIGLDGSVLNSHTLGDFQQAARLLREEGLPCTLHGPFSRLDPGNIDEGRLRLTRERLRQTFELIPVFEPRSIVCHLNYQQYTGQKDWLATAIETWQALLEIARQYQTPIMFENTYETGPAIHQKLLTALASPLARFCLDVGHVISFAGSTWQEWLPAMDPWLGQLHLHDNQGDADAHLAIGKGNFDFKGLFAYLKENGLQPLITLEPHQENGLFESLEALDELNIFPPPAL